MNKTIKEIFDSLKLEELPFNPFSIAESWGLVLDQEVTTKQLKHAGSLKKDANGIVKLWVNPFDEEGRRNYIAAYLLGRYVKGDLDNRNVLIVTPYDVYKRN